MEIALKLLARNGYESTTVDELADAAQISRSTFFRRFGSKDDIVFADHDFLIERLQTQLTDFLGDPLNAVQEGTRQVLDYHLRRPETSRLRHELLQQNPVLRDRELITSYRYERSIADFLRAALPAAPEWATLAFASSVVSTHNFELRGWLRDPSTDAASALATELKQLVELFRPLLKQDATTELPTPARQVIVALVQSGETPAQALRSIARDLESAEA
ncbi:TetR/AcrR family transcriptional regulator [Leifsonia sp. A12D58]|uniref:TetR/AcrR family transcriptional regulator n=1 Tax=Leifsonia sp. A12D58 TaxID=3397674 RepID=UPI0039E1B41F